jgi:hypothetical protein
VSHQPAPSGQRCYNRQMASYTITIASIKGKVTATTSDGHTLATTTPLLTGARYWQQLGAPSSAVITTSWSSASPEWTLRSTISQAAKLTVMGDYFRPYKGD